MNRILSRVGLLCLVLLPAVASAERCADYTEARLAGLLNRVALVAEKTDALVNGHSPAVAAQASTLRLLAETHDPAALDVACDLLARFPSLESALDTASRDLDRTEIVEWSRGLGKIGTEASTTACISTTSFEAVRGILTVLRVTNFVLQSVCDSLSCYTGACRVCVASGVVGAVLPAFEAGLEADLTGCGNAHTSAMTEYCTVDNGACGLDKGSAPTLFELESEISGPLVETLGTISVDVASQRTLVETRGLIDQGIARTLEQISGIEARVAAGADARSRFQEDLRVLDIEAGLSGPIEAIPLQFQLPEAFNGRLEEVRETVADAIVASQHAGIDTGSALDELRAGDLLLNAGKFGAAFGAYRAAYLELIP